jgi:branched-chain amino acid transport system substrate-binding protein
MLTIEVEGLTGTAKWTADGECDKSPKAVVIKNGVYEMME